MKKNFKLRNLSFRKSVYENDAVSCQMGSSCIVCKSFSDNEAALCGFVDFFLGVYYGEVGLGPSFWDSHRLRFVRG